jgi:hypothetical protein
MLNKFSSLHKTVFEVNNKFLCFTGYAGSYSWGTLRGKYITMDLQQKRKLAESNTKKESWGFYFLPTQVLLSSVRPASCPSDNLFQQ